MKHVLILAAAIVIALSGQAFARIGQTEDQINALFGKPVDPGKPDSDGITTNMYKNLTGEYIAVVQFLKGHSVSESYARVDSRKLSEKNCRSFFRKILAAKNGKRIQAASSRGKEAITALKHGTKRSREDLLC